MIKQGLPNLMHAQLTVYLGGVVGNDLEIPLVISLVIDAPCYYYVIGHVTVFTGPVAT